VVAIRVPVCSTVFELKPSIPTQVAASAVPELLSSVGTVHDPLAEVTEPVAPVTAYPLQLVLFQLLLFELSTFIPGAIIGLAKANAELKAAKSISKLTNSVGNFVAFFIQIFPY
jgi:hypothetical protein